MRRAVCGENRFEPYCLLSGQIKIEVVVWVEA